MKVEGSKVGIGLKTKIKEQLQKFENERGGHNKQNADEDPEKNQDQKIPMAATKWSEVLIKNEYDEYTPRRITSAVEWLIKFGKFDSDGNDDTDGKNCFLKIAIDNPIESTTKINQEGPELSHLNYDFIFEGHKFTGHIYLDIFESYTIPSRDLQSTIKGDVHGKDNMFDMFNKDGNLDFVIDYRAKSLKQKLVLKTNAFHAESEKLKIPKKGARQRRG